MCLLCLTFCNIKFHESCAQSAHAAAAWFAGQQPRLKDTAFVTDPGLRGPLSSLSQNPLHTASAGTVTLDLHVLVSGLSALTAAADAQQAGGNLMQQREARQLDDLLDAEQSKQPEMSLGLTFMRQVRISPVLKTIKGC